MTSTLFARPRAEDFHDRYVAEDRARAYRQGDADGDRAAIGRVTQPFLAMTKFDIAALERAYTRR